MGVPPVRAAFDRMIRRSIEQDPDLFRAKTPTPIPHSDFTTPEYTQYEATQAKKWEMTRGIGNSFGYNREETDADYARFREVLGPAFLDAVAKNGNLLLNVGPSGGRGSIVPEQASGLSQLKVGIGGTSGTSDDARTREDSDEQEVYRPTDG
jgi:alpha-L-fucosidase